MEISYSKEVIDLVEQNKRFISQKNSPIETIPTETEIVKTEVEVPLIENINRAISRDYDSRKEQLSTPVTVTQPFKELNELNLKYISQTDRVQEVANLEFIPTLDDAKIIVSNIDTIENPLSTGIDIVDGLGNSLASGVQSVLNYGSQISNGFSGVTTPQAIIDNYAIYEKKSDIKKTVALGTINAIPYNIDNTIKQFQSGSALNSIISGVIGTVNNIAELAGSFYDANEVLELVSVSYNQIANGGKLFSGDGFFGFNPTIGGARPQIKIKKKTEDGKDYKTMSFGVPELNGLAGRNESGYLYVRPFQNQIPVFPFRIPFQMSPKINEDTIQANYASEQFLNRVGEIKSYINTSSQTVSIETSYLVLSDGNKADAYKRNNTQYSSWMDVWTQDYVQSIENAYRSLVYPTYYSGINNPVKRETVVSGFLKPPSVRILMADVSNSSLDNELYNYPQKKYVYNSEGDNFSYDSTNSIGVFSNNDFTSTLKRLSVDETISQNYKWNKCFVVTGVNITREDDVLVSKTSSGAYTYNGFKVNVTLSEITENYLDVIPDFTSYYNSYAGALDIQRTSPASSSTPNTSSTPTISEDAYSLSVIPADLNTENTSVTGA